MKTKEVTINGSTFEASVHDDGTLEVHIRELPAPEDDGKLLHFQKLFSRDDGKTWSAPTWGRYCKNSETPWFTKGPEARMAAAGIEGVAKQRTIEFEQMFDAIPYEGYYYLAVAAEEGAGEESLKWIMGGVAAELNANSLPATEISDLIPANVLGQFATKLTAGDIDRTFAKEIFAELIKNRHPTKEHLDELIADPRFKGADDSELITWVEEAMAENPEQVEKARENPKLVQWFVGQVMKKSKGKASPPKAIELIKERL